MRLSSYDDKRVRLTLDDGSVYEGVCSHDSEEYNEHEIGHAEEGLSLGCWLFWKSQIVKVEVLGDEGPWGGYSGPYGQLELQLAADGPVLVSEQITIEDGELPLRMMRCIEAEEDLRPLLRDGEVRDALEEAMQLNESTEVKQMAERLLAIGDDNECGEEEG